MLAIIQFSDFAWMQFQILKMEMDGLVCPTDPIYHHCFQCKLCTVASIVGAKTFSYCSTQLIATAKAEMALNSDVVQFFVTFLVALISGSTVQYSTKLYHTVQYYTVQNFVLLLPLI